MSRDERIKLNAIKSAFDEVLENLLINLYTESSIGGYVVDFLNKNGYRAILASGTRAVAELTSNVGFALVTNPIEFAVGSKIGVGFLNSDDAVLTMKSLKSTQTNRIYPNGDMSGRMIDPSIQNESSKGLKGDKASSEIKNRASQAWGFTGAVWTGKVAAIADGLISTPDKIVMRPMWFGSFSFKFENITGKKPDLKKIASEDEKYMNDFKEALDESTKHADETSIMTGSTSNPFLGMLKGVKKPNDSVSVKVFKTFNNFMTTFLIYEYITARTGIVNAVGKGHLSKTKGAQLLAGSATRMIIYTMMSQVLAEGFKNLFLEDEEIEAKEEDEKSFLKQLGQSIAGTISSMVFGRDFGNATKLFTNQLVEMFNKEYLGSLRDGEYDDYKDALTYSIIPKDKTGRGTKTGDWLAPIAGPLSPMIKTIDLMQQKYTEAEKKEPEAIKKRKDEILLRLPLEIAGNLGLVPLYKDVRKIVLENIYGDMRKSLKDAADKKEFDKERLKGYKNKTEMKRYDPELYEKQFGEESELYEYEEEQREIKRNLKKEEQRLKDIEMGYTPSKKDSKKKSAWGKKSGKKKSAWGKGW
jgi:hypothetical protein